MKRLFLAALAATTATMVLAATPEGTTGRVTLDAPACRAISDWHAILDMIRIKDEAGVRSLLAARGPDCTWLKEGTQVQVMSALPGRDTYGPIRCYRRIGEADCFWTLQATE